MNTHRIETAGTIPAVSRSSDEGELRRAQAGDRAAYGELVRRHQDGVYRFVLRMVGSRDEALELTQDVFLKAWRALPGWQPQAAFRTWLFSIASNAATDALRRRRTVEFVALDESYDAPAATPDPEAQLASRQRLKAVDRALSRLPHEQREALLLRELEDLSYAEIARTLGVNEGTVKSRLARAREALAIEMRRKDV